MIRKNEKCMWDTNPEQAKLLANPEDGYIYTEGSSKKVDWICPNCGTILSNKCISLVNRYRLVCSKCSDNISYPNKLVSNVLAYIHINHECEKTFDWLKNKRYDININNKIIIENHGLQHYEDCFFNKLSKKTLKEEQDNDKFKEKIAVQNDIVEYIVLDCRYSNLEWIKK